MTNPHAMFFEQMFSRLDIATDFISNYLPENVVKLLDISSLELERKSFINKQLQGMQSDILYKIKTIDGIPLWIYVLLEHKSYIDRWVLFQVLGYIVQIGDHERMINKAKRKQEKHRNRSKNNNTEIEFLTPVIPIIVYHGPKKWDIPAHLSQIYQNIGPFKPYIPDFKFEVVDLRQYTDAQIKGTVYLRVIFLVMKYYFSNYEDHKLSKILSLLTDLIQQRSTIDFLCVLFEYIGTNNSCDESFIKSNIQESFQEKGDKIMYSMADKYKDIGRMEGRMEGKMEGKMEGRNEALTRMLDILFIERFGTFPTKIKNQLNQIDNVKIEDLTRAALKFNSLNDYDQWWDNYFSAKH